MIRIKISFIAYFSSNHSLFCQHGFYAINGTVGKTVVIWIEMCSRNDLIRVVGMDFPSIIELLVEQ